MAKRIAVSTLNASTVDILNTIRANASAEYQSLVPEVTKETDIPKVGESFRGYPGLANQFLTALMNRIALVRVRSAVFNNPYADLKKGFLEYGETIEEVFVNISKAMEFSAEKAEKRELKRYIPDVRAAFHCVNFRALYPVTIQEQDLEMAFTSLSGVQDMIARIVDQIYTSANYDEFLLFKYLIIKAVTSGKMYPKTFDGTDIKSAAVAFRGTSNLMTFVGTNYNAEGVHTATPKNDQIIFMDSTFNAQYDVDVLSAAFNMDKASFSGRLYLIDDWTTFDNDRFSIIVENSDQIGLVTEQELALMKGVKAVLCDREWFQFYDKLAIFKEREVGSGLYWNYFYHTWKVVASSPFSNAVVFVEKAEEVTLPESITLEVMSKDVSEEATVFTVEAQETTPALTGDSIMFVQTQDAVENSVAVHKYGAYVFPALASDVSVEITVNGVTYTTETKLGTATEQGATLEMTKKVD